MPQEVLATVYLVTVSQGARPVETGGSHHRPTDGDVPVPARCPSAGPSAIPSWEEGWPDHTDKESRGVKRGQEAALTDLGLASGSGTAEAHRKFSLSGAGLEQWEKGPGGSLGRGRNGPRLQVPPHQILPFATFSYWF